MLKYRQIYNAHIYIKTIIFWKSRDQNSLAALSTLHKNNMWVNDSLSNDKSPRQKQ